MPRPRKTIDASGTRVRLDSLSQRIRREAEGADADPFDDATLAALAGVVESLKAEADALAALEERATKLARRTPP